MGKFRSSTLSTYEWYAFVIIILAFTAIIFLRIRLLCTYTPDVGGIEQNVIYSCQQVAAGLPLYTDPEKAPFSFTQYSPLYFYVVGYTGKLCRLEVSSPFPWFLLSRLYSLVFNLLLIGIFYRILRKTSPLSPILHLALSLLLFVFIEQHDYSRPDSLFHLFFGLVVMFAVRGVLTDSFKQQSNNLALAGLWTGFSLFSKQSGILIFAFVFLFLFLTKSLRRQLLFYVSAFVLSCFSLGFLLFHETTDVLLKNLWLGILNGVDFRWALKLFLLPALNRYFLVFLLAFLILKHGKQIGTQAFSRFLLTGMVFFLIVALAEGIKWGSGTNYFFEFVFLTLLLFPLYYAIYRMNPSRKLPSAVFLACFGCLLVMQVFLVYWRDYYKNDKATYLAERALYQSMCPEIYSGKNKVVAVLDRKWLNNFFYDRAYFPQPDIYMNLWNPDPGISKLHPLPLSSTDTLFVIQNNRDTLRTFYHLDLHNYIVFKHINNFTLSVKMNESTSP